MPAPPGGQDTGVFRLRIWLSDPANRVWLAPAVAVVLGVGLSLGAWLLNDVAAPDAVPDVTADSLDTMLSILASSMLAVATFSLGIMVSAFTAASTSATPRATELVMRDESTRTAIGAFIGAFAYAVVAKTALSVEVYGPVGRALLFGATLAVLALVAVRLVMWVRTLSTLGRMDDTLARIQEAAGGALRAHRREPYLGGVRAPDGTLLGDEVRCRRVGYLTHIDMAAVAAAAEAAGAVCHVRVRPGAFVEPGTVLAVTEGGPVDADRVARAFVVGSRRSFDQDPRFGFIVLSEVAQRALSPAVNDPGTAIRVLAITTELLVATSPDGDPEQPVPARFTSVTVPPLDEGELVTESFAPVARDGAAVFEVAMRLQKLLAAVAAHNPGPMADAAVAGARESLERSLPALVLERERARLEDAHRAGFPAA